jgi:hypothetical protein
VFQALPALLVQTSLPAVTECVAVETSTHSVETSGPWFQIDAPVFALTAEDITCNPPCTTTSKNLDSTLDILQERVDDCLRLVHNCNTSLHSLEKDYVDQATTVASLVAKYESVECNSLKALYGLGARCVQAETSGIELSTRFSDFVDDQLLSERSLKVELGTLHSSQRNLDKGLEVLRGMVDVVSTDLVDFKVTERLHQTLISQDFEQRCVELNRRVSRMPYYRSLLDNHLKRYADEMDIVNDNFGKHAAAIKKLEAPLTRELPRVLEELQSIVSTYTCNAASDGGS